MSQPSGVTIRPATEADLPAAFAVTWRCDHGLDAEVPTDPVLLRYVRHELATGRLAVAEARGDVVGMGGAIVRGGVAMLADLFVDPRWHGRGIGAALLAEVFDDVWPRHTFSSVHPNALPLYIRAGMAPRWPSLYLTGDPAVLFGAHAGGGPADAWTADPGAEPAELAELERSWGGVWRPEDHMYWGTAARQATRVAIAFRGRPAGFAYIAVAGEPDPTWWISSMSVAPEVDQEGAVAALGSVLVLATARGIGTIGMAIPGPHPATVPLMRAGWRIIDQDLYVASEPGLIDPQRRIPNPSFA